MKRYDPDTEYTGMGSYVGTMLETDDGDYVLYSDVAPLLAERDRLRKALEEIRVLAPKGRTHAIYEIARTALTPEVSE